MGCVLQHSKQKRLVSELPTNLSVFVVLFAGIVFRISVLLRISLMALLRGFTESHPGKAKEAQKNKLKKKKKSLCKIPEEFISQKNI